MRTPIDSGIAVAVTMLEELHLVVVRLDTEEAAEEEEAA